MFNFFKKKTITLYSPIDGKVIPIEQVPDQVFASKIMGDGFGVVPTTKEIFAPLEGTIEGVFPTKHAISIKSKEGLECLVHIGIDTVELNGGPFDVMVQPGDNVKQGSLLATVDFSRIAEQGKKTDVIIIFTNFNHLGELLNIEYQEHISCNEVVGEIKIK